MLEKTNFSAKKVLNTNENTTVSTARKGAACALLAALLYGLNAPMSKLLLLGVQPVILAGLLYLGAGGGIAALRLFTRGKGMSGRRPERADTPFMIGMVLLDILAPILLLFGLQNAEAANISLLNNFEIAATALIALLLFGEKVSKRLWTAILLVTAACALLSVEDAGSLRFSRGSLCALGACLCWGLENNCTRRLSSIDPRLIVIIKGFGSGGASLALGLLIGESLPGAGVLLSALALGFVAYGLSITFYILAQRYLGAARTSAFYAAAPFIGALLSLLLFGTPPGRLFPIAFILMALGALLAAKAT